MGGGGFIFNWGVLPKGGIAFDGGGATGGSKKILGWGAGRPTMGNTVNTASCIQKVLHK